ncbi:MAG: Hsp20/alpha crystallin family protein [Cyclobacteriaceae bacterium]
MALLKFVNNGFKNEVDQLLNQFGNEYAQNLAIRPTVDVAETEKQYHLFIELPGVKKEDIEVQIDNNTLTITAKRNRPELAEQVKWHRSESHVGNYEKSFNISDNLMTNNIETRFENGILKLDFTKKVEKPFKKTIKIS